MCRFVVNSELADKNVFTKLGVFLAGNVQGYSFHPLKRYKPTKHFFCAQENCMESLGTVKV